MSRQIDPPESDEQDFARDRRIREQDQHNHRQGGLHPEGKYKVLRRDPDTGEYVETAPEATYFVLRADQDPAALIALQKYATVVYSINSELGEDLWGLVDRLCENRMLFGRAVAVQSTSHPSFMDSLPHSPEGGGALLRALDLLEEVVEYLGDTEQAPSTTWWRDYFLFTGEEMYLTDYGWEPRESAEAYLDDAREKWPRQWREEMEETIIDSVNVPEDDPLYEPAEPETPQTVHDITALVVEDPPPLDWFEGLFPNELSKVADWAGALHLRAAGKQGVNVPEKPSILTKYQENR